MSILVTGGAGYIGSHTCLELIESGYDVVVVDNLSNSRRESVRRVETLTGKPIAFHQVDLLDKPALEKVFASSHIEAVVHFAGLKAVGESVTIPLRYYHNNVSGSVTLFEVMAQSGVKDIVFSSSATVYGFPENVPVTEDFPVNPTNPYGRNKWMIEEILKDQHAADSAWNIILLRYFNPVGAHPSGRIGEDPRGVPNNLMPHIAQVAVGKLPKLPVYGTDYPTPDGTGVRDYIHIVDLARGHLKSLDKLKQKPGVEIYNLGTGRGFSVFELITAFEHASGVKINYEVVARRPGDVPESYADPSKANRELNWRAEKTIEDMCADTWRWQSNNPRGYE